MSYHRFVGAAILLLANVFHCAVCVDNRIINDIPCVKLWGQYTAPQNPSEVAVAQALQSLPS